MGGTNAAVVAVGRTFFRVTLIGYALSGLAMFPAVILGLRNGFFQWEMDRCSCVATVQPAPASQPNAGAAAVPTECVFGQDIAKVSIGWQKFTYDELKHTVGCPEAYQAYATNPAALKDRLDDPQTFEVFDKVYSLNGVFQKTKFPTQADEDNGGASAGGGVVAMLVICCFFSIFTHKMLKASYYSNGSHCSVGLGLMTRLNFLVGLGAAAAIVSFWWLIEGRFGDEDKALTAALEDTMFNECWSEQSPALQGVVVDQLDCPVRPWDFTGPGIALLCGIFQVALFLLMTLYMFWKAPTVEGVLDGSMDPTGVMLKPRVVEVEMVVGKALATDGDPDYDSENPLYNGAATMIRPYPLPKSAKAAKAAAAMEGETDEAILAAAAAAAAANGSDTASSDYEAKEDPEMQGEDDLSMMQSEYTGHPADLEMIVEESEEDRTSSRFESEARYSAQGQEYSETYSDYDNRSSVDQARR